MIYCMVIGVVATTFGTETVTEKQRNENYKDRHKVELSRRRKSIIKTTTTIVEVMLGKINVE